MIGHFPTPLPDELLYSVVARYSDTEPISCARIKQDLFGSSSCKVATDLPTHITHLTSTIPGCHSLTETELISKHTLFNFYAPFLTREKHSTTLEGMLQHPTTGIYLRLGLVSSGAHLPGYLRYCTRCTEKDTAEFGEPYWHCSHQLPGIVVCPWHGALLHCSMLKYAAHTSLVSLAVYLRKKQDEPPAEFHLDPIKEVLLADDAAWLLTTELQVDMVCLRDRYLAALRLAGFVTHDGEIRARELVQAFERHFDQDFLVRAASFTAGKNPRNWVRRIIAGRETHPPIRHLLILNFLSLRAKDFFDLDTSYAPFGNPPYPCLNPVCPSYRKPVIKTIDIHSSKKLRSRPVAIFRCECGFSYRRAGPDKVDSDRYRIGQIVSYGQIWEDAFREVWNIKGLTQHEKSKLMHCSLDTLRNQGIRLQLIKPTQTKKIPKKASTRDRQSLQQTNRNVSSSRLNGGRKQKVNWQQRDDDIYLQALQAIDVLGKIKPPVQITVNSLNDFIGLHKTALHRDLARLPRTAALLQSYRESDEEFALRRLRLVLQELTAVCQTRGRAEILKRAGIGPALRTQEVESTIQEFLAQQKKN